MNQTARQMPRIDLADAQGLLAYMREETAARREMIRHLEAARPLLVAGDAKGLERRFADVEPVVRLLEELGRRRTLIVDRVLKRLGLRDVVLKLSALVQISPPEMQAEMERARLDLKAALTELSEINRRNALITRTALDFNQKVIQAAFGEETATKFYDATATPHDPVPHQHFLDQEL